MLYGQGGVGFAFFVVVDPFFFKTRNYTLGLFSISILKGEDNTVSSYFVSGAVFRHGALLSSREICTGPFILAL